MSVLFRLATHITEEEQLNLFCWGHDIYNDNHYGLVWRPRHWHLFVYATDELVGHIGIVRHTIQVEDQPVNAGGIGQVVTLPAVQRRGYATLALQQAAAFLCHNLEVDFGMLFCVPRMIPFYQRRGWQHIATTVLIDQPEGSIVSPVPVMVLPCCQRIWPTGLVDLCSLPW